MRLTERIQLVFSFVGLLFALGGSSVLHAENFPRLTVVNLNIWAGLHEMDFERLDLQIQGMRQYSPDIITLQEAYDERGKRIYRNSLPEFDAVSFDGPAPSNLTLTGMNALVDSMATVHRATGLFPYISGTREMFRGDGYGLKILGRRGPESSLQQETKILREYQTRGSGRFSTAAFVDRLKPRAYLAVQYQTENGPILLVNTHWSNGVKNPRRLAVAQELVAAIKELQRLPSGELMPVILTLDSNADDAEPEMRYLTQQARDTFHDKNPDLAKAPFGGKTWCGANCHTRGRLIEPDQRVDYIFTFPGSHRYLHTLESRLAFTDSPFVSDHFGVLSVLELRPQPEPLGCPALFGDGSGTIK